MEIVPVSRMDEVIKHALVREPTPIEWKEVIDAKAPVASEEDRGGMVAH